MSCDKWQNYPNYRHHINKLWFHWGIISGMSKWPPQMQAFIIIVWYILSRGLIFHSFWLWFVTRLSCTGWWWSGEDKEATRAHCHQPLPVTTTPIPIPPQVRFKHLTCTAQDCCWLTMHHQAHPAVARQYLSDKYIYFFLFHFSFQTLCLLMLI